MIEGRPGGSMARSSSLWKIAVTRYIVSILWSNRMNPAAIYRQNAVTTQSPLQIVVSLYDGALRFMKQARMDIHRKDYSARRVSLSRAQDIVFELNASLNMQAGADIAKNLRALYTFVWTRLNEVNTKNDVVLLERLIGIFEDLAGAWRHISA